jgi:hypothetical protein
MEFSSVEKYSQCKLTNSSDIILAVAELVALVQEATDNN